MILILVFLGYTSRNSNFVAQKMNKIINLEKQITN